MLLEPHHDQQDRLKKAAVPAMDLIIITDNKTLPDGFLTSAVFKS